MAVAQSYLVSKPSSSEIIPEARPCHQDLKQSLEPNVQILSLLQTILFQVTTPSTQPIIW